MASDTEAVQAVLDGRREAFAELVRRWEGAVHAAAMGVLRDHHAAQDVCQDAFVAAYRMLGRLREPSSFGPWVVRIARNRALTMVRMGPCEEPLNDCYPAACPAGEDSQERIEALLSAILELPEHQQTVVMLRYFGEQSLDQIADITGQPVGTVGAQLHRARARLRERLEGVQQ